MENFDGRKLNHSAREAIRIRAVQRILDGESPEVIAKTLGYHRSAVYQWLKRHKSAGIEGLKYQKIPGAQPKLTKAQKQKIFDTVTSKNPLQLKFAFALWTRKMVQELILDQFAVSLSEPSVGRLLHELGLTPQRPLRRAYQQNPERVAQWLKEEYPAIQREAKAVRATIYFGDEAGVRSDYHSGTTWAPKGQTPVIRTTGSRHSLNLVSAVSAKGAMRFMTIKGKLNADRFVEFLERLLKNQETPVFLVVDGHPVHRSTRVRTFVEATGGRLKLFHLPAYSPELNPDEQVWNQLKNHRLGKMVIKTMDDMVGKVGSAMRSIQRSPALIRSFFLHKECCYAAEWPL
jgi:transposase